MKYFLSFYISFVVAASLALLMVADAAPPVRPGQPHPDTFQAGGQDLQQYSTVTPSVKATRRASYRLATKPGCMTGSYPQFMTLVEQEALKLGLILERNNTLYLFTVWIDCGAEQIAKCGSVNIFCLPDGFPYNNDVYMSDILSVYTPGSQLSIPIHEIIGHALAVWNEQYCKGDEPPGNPCYGLGLFTSTPQWHDVMNTGEESRHGIEAIECERWQRTMWEDVPCAPAPIECAWLGFDPCSGRIRLIDQYGQPVSFEPSTGRWWNKFEEPEWAPCYIEGFVTGLRLNLLYAYLAPGGGTGDYILSRSYWTAAPAC